MHYDFIVVGAGSSGCVTANALVQHHGAKVLLLERGLLSRSMLMRMPAGSFQLMNGNTPHLRYYSSTPQTTLGGRAVPLAQANVVGGGSSVNMMVYTRGARRDYEEWDALSGGAGWGWDDLLPYLRAQEGNQRLDNAAHGGDGPMKVSDPRYVTDMTHLFIRTMQRRGLPFRADLHDGDLGGVGFVQTTTQRGERCSAADAFLSPILDDPRLTLLTNAMTTRVMIENGRATGVEFVRDGKREIAHAGSAVTLTAGALASPKLLMLSGVGPADDLKALGIEVKADAPGVGRNLQDHAIVALTAETEPGLGFSGEERGLRMVLNGVRYLLFRDGPVASNGSESIAYVTLDPAARDPDLQVYCISILSPHLGSPGNAHGITLLGNLLRPRSRGRVTLRSADPADDPLIDLNWLSDPYDLAMLTKGIRYLRDILHTAPLADIVRKELFPGAEMQSDDQIGGVVRSTVATNYHPSGTCRMGAANDPEAVLTPDLSVKGVEGLKVFDASMMPTIISSNLNATVMAVARKGVDMMMQRA